MYYISNYVSPIGKIYIASDEENIVGLFIENQKYFMEILTKCEYREKETKVLKMTKNWLDRYFNKQKTDISELPIKMIGSDFRRDVWKILLDIPYGQVTTYGNISKQIAKRYNIKSMSAQAVGGAVAHNPISIIIPCHRVVGTNGSLTGYASGIDKKIELLKLEEVDISKLFLHKND